jgi:hypothetical protein
MPDGDDENQAAAQNNEEGQDANQETPLVQNS